METEIRTFRLLSGSRARQLGRVVSLILLASAGVAAEPSDWFLMGRHGECAPLSALARKDRSLSDLKDPYQFIGRMRAAGHRTEVKEHDTAQGKALEVNVPARDFYLLFVKAEACSQRDPSKP